MSAIVRTLSMIFGLVRLVALISAPVSSM